MVQRPSFCGLSARLILYPASLEATYIASCVFALRVLRPLIQLVITLGPSNPRGRGVWKFNTQLLKNESCCAAINEFWSQWQLNKPAFPDARVWWDAGKLQLKEIAIAHSVAEASERKRDKLNLECEFRNILSRGNSNTAGDPQSLLGDRYSP